MKWIICLAVAIVGCASSAQDNAQAQAQQRDQARPAIHGDQDMVAVYRMNGPDGSQIGTMTVEADDSSAARIEMRARGSAAQQTGWVTADGEVVVMGATPEGPKLLRMSDMAAVSEEVFARISPGGRRPPSPDRMRLVSAGSETVNGRVGTRYVIRVDGESSNDGNFAMDFVIAEDPALAPIGRASSRSLNIMDRLAQGHSSAFGDLEQRLRSGAALRVGRVMILESVENRLIDPARLVVAGTPISREELRRIMLSAVPPALNRSPDVNGAEAHDPGRR